MRLPGPTSNPVLAREVKERLRTRRATIIITVYLGLLSLVLWTVYNGVSRAQNQVTDGFGGPVPQVTESAMVGRHMFEAVLLLMLGLVLFIVPGLVADAVTGERERQTLVPLQVSLLRPSSILLGKVLAALSFVGLLVVATLPLFGLSLIIGGVNLAQVLRGVVAVLFCGLVVGALTILCSSVVRRTQAAFVLGYALVVFLVLGSLAIYGSQRVLANRSRPGDLPTPAALTLNPFLAVADFVSGPSLQTSSVMEGMSSFVRDAQREREEWSDVALVRGAVAQAGPAQFGPDGVGLQAPVDDEPLVPFWARSAGVLGSLGLIAFALAARRLRTPSDRSAAG